ncbi:pyridoxine/pyridoxamine 5'-phosphate oxidase 2-like isoform X2 [Triticum dicoccoides]|uniref:pyridoxine/pyridoxamine 5'-phosphate oxidase 2-like isoform X2 n=1 Tax=Triticum dicoccoides TaxID=85692 RepID=UPI00188DED1C|nr:pyridoxine/pyridoxamine 5'-phosphate oxidase 2-like isoform X2 [Triticum dicoccoides]XP_044371837.1 pyridoxine/pyridoxamine 5'-phosphate oxidase 2-like isoform X2 [Triticum aestivum]
MAGGGAAASALSSPWRALLQRALDANAHLKHSTFFQLATVGAGGRPANRTVVFRGFQEHCDKIQINTDARSNKICWYFTDSWEQFRISGIIDVIDGSSPDPAKLQQREKAWFASSVKSRSQYLGQSPGVPVANDDHIKDVHIDPSAAPVDAYCLLTLDPEKVDYVNLKSNQRLMFTRTQEGDESSDWMAEKVSP